MTQVSVSELKRNIGKYIVMAQSQDIFITKNGRITAKLVTAKPDKMAAAERFLGMFPDGVPDVDLDREKEDRLR